MTRAADLMGSRSSLLDLFRTVKEKKQVEEIHARIDAMREPGERDSQDPRVEGEEPSVSVILGASGNTRWRTTTFESGAA